MRYAILALSASFLMVVGTSPNCAAECVSCDCKQECRGNFCKQRCGAARCGARGHCGGRGCNACGIGRGRLGSGCHGCGLAAGHLGGARGHLHSLGQTLAQCHGGCNAVFHPQGLMSHFMRRPSHPIGPGGPHAGPSGPPTATYGYPYYTIRGPRDFLMNNPPTIGR